MNQRFSKCARLQDELSQLQSNKYSKKPRRNAVPETDMPLDGDWILDAEGHDSDADAMDVDSDEWDKGIPLGPSSHDRPSATHSESGTNPSQYRVVEHPSAAAVYGQGKTFMDEFRKDEFADCREETGNVYYPFASRAEWELGSFLLRSSLSMADTDQFLKLDVVRVYSLRPRTICISNNEFLP